MPAALAGADELGVADGAAVCGPEVAGMEALGAAGAGAADPSPASHGMGTPALSASMSASVSNGKPERCRYACSAEMTELLRALRGHFGSRPSAPPAVFVDSSDIRPYPFFLSIFVCTLLTCRHQTSRANFFFRAQTQSRSDQFRQCRNKCGRIVQPGGHFKALDS